MKTYHDIVGDGGSRVLEQVAEQRTRIADGLAGVRHLVAVGSGKGGVGKSTLTLHLADALRARGLRIAILDADFNGPSQARMAGVQGALFVPPPSPTGFGAASGSQKVALPRTRNGIAVFSMGSLIPESEALDFESAADGESQTWRATREFALLGEILASFEWGALDLLMFDLPPGAERTVQYADFLGPFGGAQGKPFDQAQAGQAAGLFPPRDDPFRGIARGRRALGRSSVEGTESNPRLRREHERLLLPRLQRRQAALRFRPGGFAPVPRRAQTPRAGRGRDPLQTRSIWASRCLGTVPFDPELARHCDRGIPLAESVRNSRGPGPGPCCAATSGQPRRQGAFAMKFLCVPCDSPMKLQSVAPPERGSLSVVYACPECGYEMAMLTNAYETQIVQSLGVRIGPGLARKRRARPAAGCPFSAMMPAAEGASETRPFDSAQGRPAEPIPVSMDSRRGGHGSRTFPSSSAPWRGPASRDSPGSEEPLKSTRRSSMPPATSLACRHPAFAL